ncbi:hypothetical protein M8J76_000633 [Diaphorina citri]|nr:hypothetical protein M8J75_006979 [Diaphorina citri]KAI5740116.1 hypothetical protein M8J76_000633 [Diaphorina citri]
MANRHSLTANEILSMIEDGNLSNFEDNEDDDCDCSYAPVTQPRIDTSQFETSDNSPEDLAGPSSVGSDYGAVPFRNSIMET